MIVGQLAAVLLAEIVALWAIAVYWPRLRFPWPWLIALSAGVAASVGVRVVWPFA